jgi:cell division initiation protein
LDKFTISERGYNVAQVNKFVDNVISQTENMLDKMKKQQVEIEELKNTIKALEQSSKSMSIETFEEKNQIIAEARANASRIVNDALLRAEKIEVKADTLERNMRIFKRKLRLVVEQQLAVVDDIEELELK